MKTYQLMREQFVPAPREEVFGFFSRPENLARLTPRELGFEIMTPGPLAMKAGALIDYTIRLFGVRVRWTTLITSYEPPGKFVDEQLRGPYSFWHHTHLFREADGGTMITDEVRYAMPFGPLGSLAHALFVRRNLRRIFTFREDAIGEIFGAGAASHEGGRV